MAPRKDGSNQNLEGRDRGFSSDHQRVRDEDKLDTREISHGIEEGDEDYDDEQLDDDELTEDDFDIDEDEDEEEEDL